jgi:hypothetical protein
MGAWNDSSGKLYHLEGPYPLRHRMLPSGQSPVQKKIGPGSIRSGCYMMLFEAIRMQYDLHV